MKTPGRECVCVHVFRHHKDNNADADNDYGTDKDEA